MTLIPFDDLNRLATNPMSLPTPAQGIARQVREAYCELVPRIPVVRDLPLNRYALGTICPRGVVEHPASFVGGQCDEVRYTVATEIEGFSTAGLPVRRYIPNGPPLEVWGPIEDVRVRATTSSQLTVEVLCKGRTASPPSSVTEWVSIGAAPGFNTALGGSVVSVVCVRVDGQPDNCAITPVVPPEDEIQPGDTIVDIDLNPTLDITVAPVFAPLILLPPVIAPRFEINNEGDTTVVQITNEGVEIIDNSVTTAQYGDVTNQVNNDNQTNINNQTTTLTQTIDQSKNEVIQNISFEVGGAIELAVPQAIEQFFDNYQFDIQLDYAPLFQRFDEIEILLEGGSSPDVDLQPVLDAIAQARQALSDLVTEETDEIDDDLECLLSAQPEVCELNTSIDIDTFTSTLEETVRVYSLSPAVKYVTLEVLSFDTRGIRVYKLDGQSSQVEAGFGHYSTVRGGFNESFQLLSTRKVTVGFDESDDRSRGLRVSLKPGVTVRIRAIIYTCEPFTCE